MADRRRRFALKSLKQKETIGLLLLGDTEVGKSSLIKRWLDDVYTTKYEPTSENFYNKVCIVNSINVGYIDLGGSGQFPAMEKLYIKRADGIMFVYEVGNEKTINSLQHYYKKVKSVLEKDIPFVIVGAKSDLHPSIEEEIDVSWFQELPEAPQQFLTSSRDNINVRETFEYLIGTIAFSLLQTQQRMRALTNDTIKSEKRAKRILKCQIL